MQKIGKWIWFSCLSGMVILFSCIDVIGQKNIYIYRSYVKEDNEQEKLSYEYTENKKTGINSTAFFFSSDYFSKDYHNNNGEMIARVSNHDSLFYEYFKKDSAIVYSVLEGEKTRREKLIFNKKGKTIAELGYLYKTDQVSSLTRYTYLNDTVEIGSANFHIRNLWGIIDTSQIDSSFITYDKEGRVIGEYKLKPGGEIDSMLTTEYSYTDSTEIMWGYEKVNNTYVRYKRCVDIYDKDHYILTRFMYNFPDVYDGKTEYTYELSDDKKYKNTKTINEHRADGSIWKTRTYRREVIEK